MCQEFDRSPDQRCKLARMKVPNNQSGISRSGHEPRSHQRGCSPPLDSPFDGARSKLREMFRFKAGVRPRWAETVIRQFV